MRYTKAREYLKEIAAKNTARANDLRVVKSGAANVKSALDGMPTQYAEVLAEIAVDAAAHPDDKAWQMKAAEALLLKADFLVHKTMADAMVTALEPFEV